MILGAKWRSIISTLIAIHGSQGTNYIAVDSGLEESHCGLIPLSERCQSCSSTGLKWNLGTLFLVEEMG